MHPLLTTTTTFMGGIFGVISTKQCRNDLFYGVDYHSHLGTRRGGMAVYNGDGIFARDIHSLENSYFRVKFEDDLYKYTGVKFEDDLYKYTGNLGIGVISDTDAQPIVVNSHLGRFAIVTVGKICNIADLEKEMLSQNKNFTELSSGKTNPTELIAQIITCSLPHRVQRPLRQDSPDYRKEGHRGRRTEGHRPRSSLGIVQFP